jgi:hypothetical protein
MARSQSRDRSPSVSWVDHEDRLRFPGQWDKVDTRELPSRDVTPENIEDAYVQFIFYCNPSLPTSLTTTELRRGFRSMPRTDGKSFETFALFELIKQYEKGEIGTWNALVMKLGVEPPDLSKNQSSQKLQQYAVRLKVRLVDTINELLITNVLEMGTRIPYRCFFSVSDR